MIHDPVPVRWLIGVLVGFAASYAAVMAVASLTAAGIFLAGCGRSRVRRSTLAAATGVAILRFTLLLAVAAGAGWILGGESLLRLDSDGFLCFMGAAPAIALAAFGGATTVELAVRTAAEPGFAEELALVPRHKRRLLLEVWSLPSYRSGGAAEAAPGAGAQRAALATAGHLLRQL
ncbi:MAG: hypothetical protein JSR90_21470 [Proteobacteria bacterium]|nr:hypothetical protein [Pseudomonadota bacterium]